MKWLSLGALALGLATFGAGAFDLFGSNKSEMVRINAGHAILGAPDRNSLAGPAVYSTDAYWIDRHEVTNADYAKFVRATSHQPAAFADDDEFNKPDQPVTGVTWMDARDYCSWKGKRLPSEIEWEKAARGENALIYPWGNNFKAENAYLHGETPISISAYPKQDINPAGIQGLAGGVSEWVSDVQIATGGVCGQDKSTIEEASKGTSLTVPDVLGENANLGTWVPVCETPELLSPEVVAKNMRLSLKLVDLSSPQWGIKRCAYIKGNSFNGVDHMTKLTNRMWDYTDSVAEFVGFRCAKSAK